MDEILVDNLTISQIRTELTSLREKNEEYLKVIRALGVFERSFVLAHATMEQRQRYYQLARHLMASQFDHRAALAARFEAERGTDPATEGFFVNNARGLESIDLSGHSLVQAAIGEACAFYENAAATGARFPSKDSLEFVGSAAKHFGPDSALFHLANSPLILIPVMRYFGIFPILTGFGITLARNEHFFRKSSQRLHFDPEDRSQLKVFVYLTDVGEDSGPFMAVPATESAHLFERHDHILDRQDDDVVKAGAIETFIGPAGTVIFCDTCRCLHAGARPGTRHRLMLSMEYNLPSHLGRALFPNDNEPSRCRTAALKHETDDVFVKALLELEI